MIRIALKTYNLKISPFIPFDKYYHEAYIANCNYHWIGIRLLYEKWWLFDSLKKTPMYITECNLNTYLQTVIDAGYFIFSIDGIFPHPLRQFDNKMDFYYDSNKIEAITPEYSLAASVERSLIRIKTNLLDFLSNPSNIQFFKERREKVQYKSIINDIFGKQPGLLSSSIKLRITFPDTFQITHKFNENLTGAELFFLIQKVLEIVYQYDGPFQIVGEGIMLANNKTIQSFNNDTLYIYIV